MPVDQLLFTTGVSLQGLLEGLERADSESRSRVSRINQELSRVSFEFNVTSAISSLERLTGAANAALANVRELRAALNAPITLSVSAPGLAGGSFIGGERFRRSPEQVLDTQILNDEERNNRAREREWARADATQVQMQSERIRASEHAMQEHERLQRSWGQQFGGGSMQMLAEGRRIGQAPGEFGFNPFSAYGRQFGEPSFGGSSMSEGEFRRSILTPPAPPAKAWLDKPSPALEGIAGAAAGTATMLGHALAMGAAFAAVYGSVQLVKEAFSETIGLGMNFNKELEISKIALGSLLGLSNQYKSESGATASVLATYHASLSQAASVQEKLYDLDAKTLGTGQELVQVYEKVLAFSRGQTADESARLQLSSGILNAAKIFGLTSEQTTIEARQILTLEHAQGQTILQNLGISMQEARSWKEKGTLVDELNKRLEVYNLLGTEAGNTWEGLSTTLESLKGRITAVTFTETFGAAKGVLSAVNDEFRQMRANGDILPAIFGGSQGEIRAFGADLAHLIVSTTSLVATSVNKLLEWGASLSGFFLNAKNFALSAANMAASAGGLGGMPVTYGDQAGGEAQIYDIKTRYGQFDTINTPFPYSAPTGDMFFKKPDQLGFSEIQSQLKYSEQQFAALSATSTKGMNKAEIDAYIESVSKAADALNPLRTSLDRIKGSLGGTLWRDERQHIDTVQNSLYGLNDALKSPHPLDKAPEKDAITNRRNAAIAAAERAEASVEKRAAPFTGDIDSYMGGQTEAIKADQAKKIAAAKGDGATIAAINREAAAQTEKAWQDASKLFVDFETKKQTAVDRTANAAIRATEVEMKGQTQLVDIEISGIQRQIHFAELRKEPIQTILDLYAKELLLVTHKSDLEIAGASKELDQVHKKIAAEDAIIADYDKQIAQLKTLKQDDATKGRIAELDAGEQKAQDQRLNDLTQEQKLTNDIAKAKETSLNKEIELEYKRQQLDPTFSEAVRQRVGQSEYGANKEYADIAIDGVHSIGHALTDMLNKGKLDWVSLGNVARDVLQRIEDKMLDRSIDSALNALFGGSSNGPGSIPGLSLGRPGGFNANTVNWSSAGGGQSGGGLGSLFSGVGGLFGGGTGGSGLFGGLFGGGSTATGAATGGMDLSNVAWSAGQAGGGFGANFGSMLGGAGGAGSMMGGMGGLLGAGTSVAKLTQNPGDMGSWMQLLMSIGMMFLHDGGIVSHHSGLAPDEHFARVQDGEMMLSRGETANLFSGGGARVPGGYRPDARIFMTNVGSGNRGNSGGVTSSSHGPITVHIHASDVNSYRGSEQHIAADLARKIARANRRNN